LNVAAVVSKPAFEGLIQVKWRRRAYLDHGCLKTIDPCQPTAALSTREFAGIVCVGQVIARIGRG
jgi:hypothetical protein